MKKFTIKATCAVMALALGATTFAGCGAKEENLDGTKTAIVIDGQEVTAGVVSFAVRYQQAQSEYYYASMFSMYNTDGSTSMWSQETEEGKTFGENTRDAILEQVEKMYIVREKADELGIGITEEESASMDEAAKTFIEANDEETLNVIGVTQSDVREYLELNTYYEKAFDPAIADVEIEVTDEEAAQSSVSYVYKSYNDMTDEEKEEAYTMMEGVLEKLQTSEDPTSVDIDALAEETDESLIGTTYSFGEDEELMDETLKEAVKDLKDGEVYGSVVEGENGYFVVRMDATFDEEATASKKKSLISEREQEAFDEIVQGWYDEADIKEKDGVLKLIQITDQQSFSIATAETAEDTTEETTEE